MTWTGGPPPCGREEGRTWYNVGVDIARANRVMGIVDDCGSEVYRTMGFKNSAAGFEQCSLA